MESPSCIAYRNEIDKFSLKIKKINSKKLSTDLFRVKITGKNCIRSNKRQTCDCSVFQKTKKSYYVEQRRTEAFVYRKQFKLNLLNKNFTEVIKNVFNPNIKTRYNLLV